MEGRLTAAAKRRYLYLLPAGQSLTLNREAVVNLENPLNKKIAS